MKSKFGKPIHFVLAACIALVLSSLGIVVLQAAPAITHPATRSSTTAPYSLFLPMLSAPLKLAEDDIVFSTSLTRASATLLAGATVSGDIYVFIQNIPSGTIKYWFDDPYRQEEAGVTSNVPFDFMGNDITGAPRPLATSALDDGIHIISVEVMVGTATMTLETSFMIKNHTASAQTLSTAAEDQPLWWGATGPITSKCGTRIHPVTGGRKWHAGTDIGAPSGAPVYAAYDGTVYQQVYSGYGNTVDIVHPNGYVTRYAHLSAFVGPNGAKVKRGDEIGKVGNTGIGTGAHLHQELRIVRDFGETNTRCVDANYSLGQTVMARTPIAYNVNLPSPTPPAYTWAYVSQAAYTDSSKSVPLALNMLDPGQRGWYVVRVRNTGTATWYQGGTVPVRVALWPSDRQQSSFYSPDWLSQNRPAELREASVAPNSEATFEFPFVAPTTPGTYQERYNLVAEGVTFFNDIGAYIPAHVRGSCLNGPTVGGTSTQEDAGYWLVGSDGGIFSYGSAPFHGSAGNIRLNKPVVGMVSTADGGGYWLIAADGGIFAYGNATPVANNPLPSMTLNQPIVGATRAGNSAGLWLVAADGGVFALNEAPFHGSAGDIHLNKPVVGMVSTADGGGYWLIAADGGIFAYGNATPVANNPLPSMTLNQPIVGATRAGNSVNLWLVAADGGVFALNEAPFHGSAGDIHLNKPVVGMVSTADGGGYWLIAADGGIFAYGNARFFGSPAGC